MIVEKNQSDLNFTPFVILSEIQEPPVPLLSINSIMYMGCQLTALNNLGNFFGSEAIVKCGVPGIVFARPYKKYKISYNCKMILSEFQDPPVPLLYSNSIIWEVS